jgi:Protein of unknown function (DUF1116)
MTDVDGTDVHPADHAAFAAASGVRPMWKSQRRASDAIGLAKNVLLHAGPAFESAADVSRPIRNSACVAAVFEGLAQSFAEAADAVDTGAIRLRPAQDLNAVVPLASVISASMWLHEIVDATNPRRRAFAQINGGGGPALRLGVCSEQTLAHLRWLNDEFAEVLARLLGEPVDLIEIAKGGLAAGDDCHGRTGAATGLLEARFRNALAAHPRSQEFLQTGPSFFLNLWMAACRCVLNGAVGVAGSSLVTAAGGNGRNFGIQLAGAPGRWIVVHADAPHGPLYHGPERVQPLGAIGDSAIVDVAGFGAMALRYSEAQIRALGPYVPDDGLARPARLFLDRWPAFGDLNLLTGLCARRVVAAGTSPLVSLGILDAAGVRGRLSGGVYAIPVQLFVQALDALRA